MTSKHEHDCLTHNGEYQSGGEWHAAYITGNTFSRKLVKYIVRDGWAICEGDIVLGPAEAVVAASRREGGLNTTSHAALIPFGIGISGPGLRWPGGVIPFQIDASLTNQARVNDAINHWQNNTVIRFVAREAEANFVTFRLGTGCNSRVGMVGGEQFVNLDTTCTTGNVIHEIGHLVGLWHEQSREDRNSFVTIDYTNIAAADWPQFDQRITDGDDIGAYDYGSIMHYGANAFAIDATQPTIIASQPIGQRARLSEGDISTVIVLYVENFGTPILQVPTWLNHTDVEWSFTLADWDRDGKPDLVGIFRKGGSGKTEVHIFSGASNFGTPILQVPTWLDHTDAEWSFTMADWDRDGIPDLVGIFRKGGSGQTEVHIFSGASNFQRPILQVPTWLDHTDDQWSFTMADWDGDGIPDLVGILRRGGSNRTEVHIFSGASNFQIPILQTTTWLRPTDSNWDFILANWGGDRKPDLVGILRRGASGRTEAHIFRG